MQEHDLPRALSFEEDIGFLIVLVRDLTFRIAGPHVKDVAGNGSVTAWSDLNVQVREGGGFYSSAAPNEVGPVLLIGGQIRAAFRQPL